MSYSGDEGTLTGTTTAAGPWMLLSRHSTARDRWIALLAIALFGAGGVFELKDLLGMLRARRGR